MRKQFTLKPVKSGISKYNGEPYYEQILLMDGDYPAALFHIDTLHTPNRNAKEIYDRLNVGKEVKVEMELKIIEEE